MCSTGPFQFRWLRGYIHRSCYYHHQIGSINLTHHHIFPWLCAWAVCYIIFCHLLHIHSGKTGILFSLLLCRLWWEQTSGYVLACRSCSYVCTLHHLILSEDIELMKCLSDIFVECVSKIKHIFSVIHYTIYGGCVFLVYPFSLWWLREYTLCLIIIIKSNVWIIIHCLGLGHETMLCAVCLSIFLFEVELHVDCSKVIQNTINVISLHPGEVPVDKVT